MTSWLFIMEKTNTFLDDMIHITFKNVVHLHGHWNKVVPIMEPSIFANLAMALSFVDAPTGQLMTLIAIVSPIESIATTLATKT